MSTYCYTHRPVLRRPLEPKQYTSHQLERELRRHGALASMGSVADCFDNALAESAFATLECELFDSQPGGRFQTRRQAKLAVFDFLETFYNPRRRHSALQMRSPLAFEAAHRAAIVGVRSEAA